MKKIQLAMISSNEMLLLQAPLRLCVTLFSIRSWKDIRFWDLPVTGVMCTMLTTVVTVTAGFQYQNSLRSGGSGGAVAAVTGSYPAVAYFIGAMLGMEEVSRYKVLGVIFACLSCFMFSL
jgi:drug/metabolite transporter (DMT)-like permease